MAAHHRPSAGGRPSLPRRSQGRRVARVSPPGFIPVEATLRRPSARDGVIVRGELVDILRGHTDRPVVLVTGPAGYGKSTLVAQWDDEDRRQFVWVTLDRSANDPAVLVSYIALAMQRLGEDAGGGVWDAIVARSPVSTVVLPRLGRLLAQQVEPFVLVLDDAQSLSSTDALAVLTIVIDHLSVGSQLVLLARSAPDLPWGQLRAERRLLTIGPDMLRLSPAETRAVLADAGLASGADDVDALLENTEGWPAGAYLAARTLRAAAQQRDLLTALRGPDGVVARYLHDELYAALPERQQRFMVRTAVLRRMSGPLCDAVLGTTGSGRLLRELERSNVFVVPLDDHEEWYRYHTLFAEMLQAELAKEDVGLVARLHSRASRWWEAEGELEEAMRHAQAANEVVRAARLLWSRTANLLASGHVSTLREGLEAFPAEQVLRYTKLSLTAAWCALEAGRPADHWVTAAERGLFDAGRPHEQDSVASAVALLRAQQARDGVMRMRAAAEKAARLQTPDDPWRAYALYLRGVAILLAGAPDEAVGFLQSAAELAATLGLPCHRALCLAQLAAVAIEAGDWPHAEELSREASDLINDGNVEDSVSTSIVRCVATLLLAKQGHTDEARKHAQRCMRMIAILNHSPPWLAVQTRYLLGRARLLMGDSAAARILFSEAQTHLHAAQDASWLAERIDRAWTNVEKFPLASGLGPSAVTSAEMRVLQLLPTHLSFEQIAKRLSLSRNTVKTEAIAAYRKLGVSSRSEAVERARSLGMVVGP